MTILLKIQEIPWEISCIVQKKQLKQLRFAALRKRTEEKQQKLKNLKKELHELYS